MPYGPRRQDPETIGALLSFDSLAAAEDLTGKSYKEDPATMALGFGMHVTAARLKNEALAAALDTYMQMTWTYLLSVVEREGFQEAYSADFVGYGGQPETFKVWWHPAGLLMRAESFGDKVNSAEVYFNWRNAGAEAAWPTPACSGGFSRRDNYRTYVGRKDVRDGLCHFIGVMEAGGSWVSPWIERPFLWLLNYQQPKTEGYDHKALTEAVIAALPTDVRAAISPDSRDAP